MVGARSSTIKTGPDSSTIERDRRMVAALLEKNRKAAAEFVAMYTDRVYSYVHYRLMPHADRVDDIVQEVFLTAWDHLDKYEGRASLRNWMLGIARHKVESYYRAQLREGRTLDIDEDIVTGVADDPEEFEQLLDRKRRLERTQEVLQELPESCRLLLFWRYWEKRSTREIAASIEKSEKAVERALARARTQFRRRWDRG